MEKQFKCTAASCSAAFKQKRNLATHVATKHLLIVFKCDQCDKKYTRNSRLTSHIKKIHDGIKPFSCGTCKKRFGRRDHLRRHEKTHGERKTYDCEKCVKKFVSKQALQLHRATHDKKRVLWLCSMCNKNFSGEHSLYRHMRQSCPRNLECFYCKKTFQTTDECSKCEKGCSKKYKKFQFCVTCGKKFVFRKDRVECQQIHSIREEKTCMCNKCGVCHRQEETFRCETGFYGEKLESGHYCDYCGTKHDTVGGQSKCYLACSAAAYASNN